MEAIFGATETRTVPADADRSFAAAARPRRRRGILIAGISAAVVAAGGLALEQRRSAPVPATTAVRSEPARRVAPHPPAVVVKPAPKPVPSLPLSTPSVAKQIEPQARTEGIVAAADTRPAKSVARPEAKPSKPRVAKGPSAESLDRRARRYAFDDDTPVRGRCGGLDPYRRHACLLDALETSDRRLRRAYDDAIDAGVSRSDLISRRARWSALRRQAPSRPAYVVASYDALADEFYTLGARRR